MAFIIPILLSLSFVIALLVYLHLKIKYSRQSKCFAQLPTPPKLPILGNALEFNGSNEEMTRVALEYHRKYGSRFYVQLGPRFYFATINTSDLEKILGSSEYITKSNEYRFGANWGGEGLILSTGEKWFHRRKLLTPCFHLRLLQDFVATFNEHAAVFTDSLAKNGQDGQRPLEVCNYVTRCALDIICEAAMGQKINAQSGEHSPYFTAVSGMGALFQHRAARPWLYPDILWNLSPAGRRERRYIKILHGFTESVIQKRKLELQKAFMEENQLAVQSQQDGAELQKAAPPKSKGVAFLDKLLEWQASRPEDLTDKDVREEVDTFMFAGHDTTASNLSWTIYLLGLHPEIQEKALEEQMEIFDNDMNAPVSVQDLSKMQYLECCIKESLRLYPPVPFIAREATQDILLDDGVVVPKGCGIGVIIQSLHRDGNIWTDPEEYQPERFLPENAKGRHPFAFVPFSAGPRSCIGQRFAMMEQKVLLSYLLRHHRMESVDKWEDVVVTTEMILKPRDGLHVKFHTR